MISPETQSPHWEWYYIAMYFYIGGVSAGAYFIGSLVELLGKENLREASRIAYLIAFPLICITPILLIADLGQPLRFWHLFFYSRNGIPYMNLTSALSVGTWALLIYSGMSFLSFLNVLASDGRIKYPALTNLLSLFNRIPHKIFAAVGSFFGFFVAGYTGVLLNATARPLWAAADPLIGPLFIVSAASTGAAAIVLVMGWQRIAAGEAFAHLEIFDRNAMLLEFVLIALLIIIAGRFAAPLLLGWYGFLFWVGGIGAGILAPLWLQWSARRPGAAAADRTMLIAVLVLFGGAMLRISIVQAGQL